MKMYPIILVMGLFALLSCQEQEKEVLDMNDIMNIETQDEEQPEIEVSEEDSLAFIRDYFRSGGFTFDSLLPRLSRFYPERFRPLRKDKYALMFGEDSTIICQWVYEDSSRVTNAFFNWMDCFGDDCESVSIGEEKRIAKSSISIYANDTTLIYFSSNQDNQKAWSKFLETAGYEEDWNYILEQKRYGKTRWFKSEEDERISIESITD